MLFLYAFTNYQKLAILNAIYCIHDWTYIWSHIYIYVFTLSIYRVYISYIYIFAYPILVCIYHLQTPLTNSSNQSGVSQTFLVISVDFPRQDYTSTASGLVTILEQFGLVQPPPPMLPTAPPPPWHTHPPHCPPPWHTHSPPPLRQNIRASGCSCYPFGVLHRWWWFWIAVEGPVLLLHRTCPSCSSRTYWYSSNYCYL